MSYSTSDFYEKQALYEKMFMHVHYTAMEKGHKVKEVRIHPKYAAHLMAYGTSVNEFSGVPVTIDKHVECMEFILE